MRFFGMLSVAIFFLGVFISTLFNPWFDLSKHTFSKLGNQNLASKPWIFSLFVSIGGAFMTIYGIYIVSRSKGKLEIVGGTYVLTSGVFMTLVGIFPDGTKPHDFIAFMTFYLFYIGTTIYGLGSRSKLVKIIPVLVLMTAISVTVKNPFPSLGYLELFGLALVVMDLIVLSQVVK